MSETESRSDPGTAPGGRRVGTADPLRGLLAAQFLGAFNDNAWKMVVTLLAIDRVAAWTPPDGLEAAAQGQTTLATVVLTLPLILFSLPGGALADQRSKRAVIIALKLVELALMAAGAVALYVGRPILALAVLAAMGAQSALFSPSKYGIMPELLPHRDLSRGNGRLEMWSTLAIIGGTGVAGTLLSLSGGRPWLVAVLFCVLALAGVVAAIQVPRVQAPRRRGGIAATWRQGIAAIRGDRALLLAVLGSVVFWGLAAVLFQVVLVYAHVVLGLGDSATLVVAAMMAGLAAGSLLAGRLSGDRVEHGLIPGGAIGLLVTTVLLAELEPGVTLTLILVGLAGLSGGLVVVPLNALKQWRPAADERGAVIAVGNIPVYAGILVGSLAAGYLAAAGLSTVALLWVAAAGILAATLWTVWLVPDALVRLFLVTATRSFYRLREVGDGEIPATGGALLVANQVSFADALLLLTSTDRPIRFLVDVSYFNQPLLRPFLSSLRAIPISSADGAKAMLKALKEAGDAVASGELVCVFPEAQITRAGMLAPFRRGLEHIVEDPDAPVIPVHLDRVWGSVFSHAGGRFFTKVPQRIPYPVTLAVGAPLRGERTVREVRRAVRELAADAWNTRVDASDPLHHTLVRTLRRWPWRFAMADQNRPDVSRFKTLVGAVAIARALRPHWRDQQRVGVLLPSTVAGALVNIAGALSGRSVVNLNFTSGRRGMESAARQAELETVVTAGVFLSKAEVEPPKGLEVIYMEELAAGIGTGDRLVAMLLALVAPIRWLERACGATRRVNAEDEATVIFSSGSTGEPKGVPLSHFNIDANLRSCVQVMPLHHDDRLIGILPLFHSFGYTVTLWMPLNLGIPVVYHPSPLDASAIGDLVREYEISLMFATPTFIQLYVRRIAPAQFGSLRLVIVGAEKLTRPVAQAFRVHFGFEPLEGYGVTETSPVLAVNVPDFRAPGLYQPGWRRGTVGQLIPGVSARIVEPETHEELEPGDEGMIVVRGPNVMDGYLKRPDLTEAAFDGPWYITGDIGRLDDDGFLEITDRYSRFSKIGGEMVPHGAVEDALQKAAGTEERAFVVTAVEDPRKGESLAVLTTLEPEEVPPILDRLPEMGLPNLFIPRKNQFVYVDEFPLLGSGKTDLKAVRGIAQERLLE